MTPPPARKLGAQVKSERRLRTEGTPSIHCPGKALRAWIEAMKISAHSKKYLSDSRYKPTCRTPSRATLDPSSTARVPFPNPPTGQGPGYLSLPIAPERLHVLLKGAHRLQFMAAPPWKSGHAHRFWVGNLPTCTWGL